MRFSSLRVGSTTIKAVSDGKSRTGKVVLRTAVGAKLVLTPAQASVKVGGVLQFTATGMSATGEKATADVTWTATGGTISTTGRLTAGNVLGTYRVISKARFGAADTSVVTVTAATSAVSKVILVPDNASLAANASMDFAGYGRTSTGDSVSAALTYTATSETITTAGRYTAGRVAGTYRVIAKSAAGPADTAAIIVTSAPVARVTLVPDVAATRADATTQPAVSN
jgi:hypothetical protein